jgi:hydrogenase expression/formation protein HypE
VSSIESAWTCPVPRAPDIIQMGHGGGGLLTHRLLERMFRPAFHNLPLDAQHDGAVLECGLSRLAFTTDSFVVRPLFFPGGDIGTLAVNGTVNDLAMCGARPLYLSAAFILEEGLPLETLQRIVESMRQAAATAGVHIVTGDTKVVERGRGDGMYITTTGIGLLEHAGTVAPSAVRPGDAVLLSGDIGRHGMAILAVRGELSFETTLLSDCASVSEPALALLAAGIDVHCLRDLTRGGLATALLEIAQTAGIHVHLREREVPIGEEVRAACELLGLDPLYVANEGRFVCFVPAAQAERAVEILRAHAVAAAACCIGDVRADAAGVLTATGILGTERVLDMLSGEQLPRIC